MPHSFRHLDHLSYGKAVAVPTIRHNGVPATHKPLEGEHVQVGEVGNMYIIADSSPVGSVEVGAENLNFIAGAS
jgi:hypothetical protein